MAQTDNPNDNSIWLFSAKMYGDMFRDSHVDLRVRRIRRSKQRFVCICDYAPPVKLTKSAVFFGVPLIYHLLQ